MPTSGKEQRSKKMSEGKLKNCHTENIIIRDCHVASLLTMILILFSFSTHATCTPTPDCASIGYTETSCETKSVKCPFDTSKLFCLPCDTSFKYDCVGANITGSTGLACGGKYASCQCDTSLGYYFDKGVCACSDITPTNCIVGAIYYPNGKCSNDYIACKNPVGIVVKDNELVMSKSLGNMTWGGYTIDISGLTNVSTEAQALSDYNGKSNTATVVAQLGADDNTSAVVMCYNYAPTGFESSKGQWYLPAYGELQSYVCNNFNTLNSTVNKLGWSGFNQQFLWSSTEYSSLQSWYAFSNNGASNLECAKACAYSTICLLAIN